MNKSFFKLALLFLIYILPVYAIFSQEDRTKLEEDKKKLEEEIKYTNQLLDQTRKTRQSSLNELVILNNKINRRERLISALGSEINLIDQQIGFSNDTISFLKKDLKNLKDEYARMIYYAYKNQNLYDRLVFIFAAEDFNQAYQRLKYFQYYNEYRKKQAAMIVEKENQLTEKIRILEQQKAEKQSLLAVQENEKGQLIIETGEKDKTIKALSRREKELQKTLREKEEAARRLKKAIEDQIAEEIHLANERSKKPGVTMEKTGEISLTPEEVQLSNSFMANKGRLPWPLEKGMISSSFGEHPHPVLSHVMIRNNGIDILTVQDAETRAIFEGVVTRVMNVPSNNNVVIIRHGEYLTVYSNLNRVYVQKGDLVATKQKIGTVYTNPEDSKTELHFEVWQSKTLLDPEEWLAGKR